MLAGAPPAASAPIHDPWPRLRHRGPDEEDRRHPGEGKRREGEGLASAVGDPAGDAGAGGGADADGEADEAQGQVEMAAAPGDIRGDQRQHHADAGAGDAIQHLNEDQGGRIGGHGEEHAAQRQGGEAQQEHEAPAAALRQRADGGGDQRHHDLGQDDAGGDEQRRLAPRPLGQRAARQREHRRIGEGEKGGREGEDHQPAVAEQLGEILGLARAWLCRRRSLHLPDMR